MHGSLRPFDHPVTSQPNQAYVYKTASNPRDQAAIPLAALTLETTQQHMTHRGENNLIHQKGVITVDEAQSASQLGGKNRNLIQLVQGPLSQYKLRSAESQMLMTLLLDIGRDLRGRQPCFRMELGLHAYMCLCKDSSLWCEWGGRNNRVHTHVICMSVVRRKMPATLPGHARCTSHVAQQEPSPALFHGCRHFCFWRG